MINSQNYGPSEVQDLSESWGEAGAGFQLACPNTFLQSPAVNPTSPPTQVSKAGRRPLLFDLIGSHVLHGAWEGTRFSRVRGSNPPAVLSGHNFSLAYKTTGVQGLDTAAVKKYCGPIRYYNYGT